jgi:hypothetical protein
VMQLCEPRMPPASEHAPGPGPAECLQQISAGQLASPSCVACTREQRCWSDQYVSVDTPREVNSEKWK